MPSKVQAYAQMAEHAATQITGSRQSWTDFLSTAARLYKYPYNEQLMIYVQRPDATACAEYDLWNNQMSRYVRRGSKGIALIDATGDKPRLRYVFDVSDTGGGKNSRRPFLWELNAEHEAPVTAMLERNYDISGNEGLAEQLQHIAAQMADEYWMGNQRDILYNIDDSFLEGYDDFNVGVAFREAATVSISYMLMKRCGIDPDGYFEHEDFLSVFDFNTPATVAALGTATSEISQRVLRQIEVTIKNYERERSKDDERSGIQPERGLSDTRPDVDRAEPADRQIREAAEELPERVSPGVVQFPAAAREAVSAPLGDRADRAEPLGADDERAAGGAGSDREPESQRPDEMGGTDEQLQGTSRGNDTRGVDLQLNPQPIQLSLFPSETEQIAQIAEAESEQPSAFSMPAKPHNPMWEDYEAVKLQHADDILLYQMGDFFEMYGADAELAAQALNLNLTSRAISGEGRVPMCGIPSHRLEQYVELLRGKYDVTISGIEELSGERRVFSLPSIDHEAEHAIDEHEAEYGADGWRAFPGNAPDQQEAAAPTPPRAITQADIDAALQSWNGDIKSKQRVERYMLDHARDKDTAAWLSREYGGAETKALFIAITGTDLETELSWPKVQRHLAKLVKEDRFFTDAEHDNLDNIDTDYIRERLAESGIVNGELVDPEALERDPFIQQVMRDAERIAQAEQAAQQPAATPTFSKPSISVGDTLYLEDGKPFIVESVTDMHIQLRDPSLYYPILRAESWESFSRLMERYPQPEQPLPEAKEKPEITSEVEAVYPAEQNHLPYDIVIERLHIDEPERGMPQNAAAELHPASENFRITDEALGAGGQKAKYGYNVAAIRTLQTIEAESRTATPEEQEMLSRYVGWGGLPQAFDKDNESWAAEYAELKGLLTDEEYNSARASTLNAHYTSPTVIRAIYEAIGNMGFTTGNILEPACGVGNFFGMLPESMAASKLYGVELDSLTGRIAKQLYPQANITISGFEKTDRRDFFDLAVGNVPFGSYKVSDRAFDKHNFLIHDYFFAKAIDQVRSGGVIAFITSKGTMDKQNPDVRRYIAQRAELLGAVRLPNNAFKANANTEVTSDILFLRKRDRPVEVTDDWLHLSQTEDGIPINSYFADHPEMVLGHMAYDSSMYGDDKETTCFPIEGADLATQLSAALSNINGQYAEAELPELGEGEPVDTSIPADPDVRNFSYTIVDGEVYYRENSRMVKPELNATAIERVKGMVELRDCVQRLIGQQLDGFISDAAIQRTQAELNDRYDAFTAKYGLLNSRGNALAFADDSAYYLLCSLEVLDENGELDHKADMFTKRTIKPHQAVESVDTASEALALSISEKARVDMDYMASLTGKTPDELADELTGVIFRLPAPVDSGAIPRYATADEYLSGNVRQKLRAAERAAEVSSVFNANVEALRAAQPKDLDASEIEVRLGATWIDKGYVQEFMEELLDPPYYLRDNIQVNYAAFTGEWNITGKSAVGYSNVAAYTTYGTDRANAYRILEDTLNLRDVRIYDTVQDPDGKERRVLNSKETTLAQQKQQAIKDAFRDWIWRDPDRRRELVQQYNELFNSSRPREYDGRHIVFSGINPEISLREHQLNAIAHILYGGNTLLAHEVGAGKSATRS